MIQQQNVRACIAALQSYGANNTTHSMKDSAHAICRSALRNRQTGRLGA